MDRTCRAVAGGAALFGCVVLLATQSHAQGLSAAGAAAPVSLPQRSAPVAPDLSGTVAVKIAAVRFWAEWERARRDASEHPKMRRLIAPAAGLTRQQQIAYVQSAVTRAIAWRSDATQWGRHDYWASAAETLTRGFGDMEDRAIVKMQALRALGFPTRDLFLTLGRDSVGGPIAVLVVRLGSAHYVLDDTGGAPFTSDKRPEFSPVITFGYGAFWAHARVEPGSAASGGSSSRATAENR